MSEAIDVGLVFVSRELSSQVLLGKGLLLLDCWRWLLIDSTMAAAAEGACWLLLDPPKFESCG